MFRELRHAEAPESGTREFTMGQKELDKAIGTRLKVLRATAGLSLNELAARSGVSRAMIGRVERGESSATAVLLGKLCVALDVTLSSVIGLSDRPPERLARLADQPIWRDPETGYRRRHASAQNVASGMEIIVVDLPGGARVPYSPWGRRAYTQQLLMLAGKLTVHIDLKRFDLNEGDCLDFDVMRAVTFENPGEVPAKYIVIVRTK
jgi:transcriptional regulator with XRE-family HTH domain